MIPRLAVSDEMVGYVMAEILRDSGDPQLTADEHERFRRRTQVGCEATLRFAEVPDCPCFVPGAWEDW